MMYITIKFKNQMQATYVAEEMRITKGFLKIINSTYGNRAIPRNEIITVEIVMIGEAS